MNELLLAMILAQAGDISTTMIGLNRGCQERAIVYRSMSAPTIALVKGGAAVTVTIGLNRTKKDYPKLSKGIAWAVLGSGVAGTVWNLRQLPHCRRP